MKSIKCLAMTSKMNQYNTECRRKVRCCDTCQNNIHLTTTHWAVTQKQYCLKSQKVTWWHPAGYNKRQPSHIPVIHRTKSHNQLWKARNIIKCQSFFRDFVITQKQSAKWQVSYLQPSLTSPKSIILFSRTVKSYRLNACTKSISAAYTSKPVNKIAHYKNQ